jgi:hypothetical protein
MVANGPARFEFLIAGTQKGGTTALHRFLSAHPDLFLPARKELHFFDNEALDWRSPDYDELHRHLAGRGAHQRAGEATPIYLYWPPAPARIRRYNRDIRLILLLRDPVARAHSHWAMEVSRGLERLPFAEAIRAGRRRVAEAADEVAGCHRVFSYVERGCYAGQIARLLALFPRALMLFLRTEDLSRTHAATLDRVCDFLGVARFAAYPTAEHVVPVATRETPPLAEADRAWLRALYRDDIARTAELTGLDLAGWSG